MFKLKRHFGLFLLVWLAGCAVDSPTLTPTESVVQATSTVTLLERPIVTSTIITSLSHQGPIIKTPHQPTATITLSPQTTMHTSSSETLPMVQKIVSGRILDLWWSPDSMILFYTLPGSVWAYNILNATVQEVTPEKSMSQTPQPGLISQLPADAKRISVSTGGNRVLFFRPLEPTRTPPPTESPGNNGEIWLGGEQGELWLWEKGDSRKISQMANCLPEYLWASNEQRVVIVAAPTLSDCQDDFALLIDLTDDTIQPLFPKADYPDYSAGSISVSGFSPDGDKLLYNRGNHFFVLDLNSFESTKLNTLVAERGQWIDDQTLLVSHHPEDDMPQVSTFNLQTFELNELIGSEQTPALQGFWILNERVSPDSEWLAFAAGQDIYEMEGLWLVDLNRNE